MESGFLEKLKKNFEIITSCCAFEEYSFKACDFNIAFTNSISSTAISCPLIKEDILNRRNFENETIAFFTNSIIKEDILKEVCDICEFYYIVYRLGILVEANNILATRFINLEGKTPFYISRENIYDISESTSLQKVLYNGFKVKMKEIKADKKKVIFQDRIKWQIKRYYDMDDSKIYCRRRLGVFICDKKVKHIKRELTNA